MKFEEVLPVWREGRKIRRKGMCWWLEGRLCRDGDDEGDYTNGDVLVGHLLAQDWEVVEEYEEVEVWDWVWYNTATGLVETLGNITEVEARNHIYVSGESYLVGKLRGTKQVLSVLKK